MCSSLHLELKIPVSSSIQHFHAGGGGGGGETLALIGVTLKISAFLGQSLRT